MGACANDGNKFYPNKNKHFFLSVEEKLDIYISTNKLDLFKNNHIQAAYFLYDLLHILDKLCTYKIKLLNTNKTLAVDTKNSERWRFRVDHIGDFEYANSRDSYLNFDFCVEIINCLQCNINNVGNIDFLKKLRLSCQNLKDSNIIYFTELLILDIEIHLITVTGNQ